MKHFIYLLIALLSYSAASQAQWQEGLDPSFGTKGISLTSGTKASYFGGVGLKNAVLQLDGEIVAVATQRVSRYKENGELDSTFAINGVFEPSLYDDSGNELLSATYNSVAMQSDGKILVVGFGDFTDGPILLFRLTSNGFLDLTFGKNGVVCNNTLGNNTAYDLTIQPDGKIIVLATQDVTDSQVIVRYHSNGQIDSSFGINGKATNMVKGTKGIWAGDVKLLPDGRIVALGYNYGVSRYLPNGTLDTSFNHTGIVLGFSTGFSPFSHSMEVQPDGKVWIAGHTFDNPTPFLLVRLKSNGTLDSAYGINGFRQYDWDTGNQNKCNDMLLLPDGKVVIGGWVMNRTTKQDNFGIIRIHPDGREDSTFGINGRLLTQMNLTASEGRAFLYKMLLQADNKILGLGYSNNPSSIEGYATIVRYYGNGKTSIGEKNKEQKFSAYPNPASNIVNLLSPNNKKIELLSISNLQGQLLQSWTKAPISSSIDVTNLPNGVYFLNVTIDGITTHQKLIIQH